MMDVCLCKRSPKLEWLGQRKHIGWSSFVLLVLQFIIIISILADLHVGLSI